jgi:hypothetical protein
MQALREAAPLTVKSSSAFVRLIAMRLLTAALFRLRDRPSREPS